MPPCRSAFFFAFFGARAGPRSQCGSRKLEYGTLMRRRALHLFLLRSHLGVSESLPACGSMFGLVLSSGGIRFTSVFLEYSLTGMCYVHECTMVPSWTPTSVDPQPSLFLAPGPLDVPSLLACPLIPIGPVTSSAPPVLSTCSLAHGSIIIVTRHLAMRAPVTFHGHLWRLLAAFWLQTSAADRHELLVATQGKMMTGVVSIRTSGVVLSIITTPAASLCIRICDQSTPSHGFCLVRTTFQTNMFSDTSNMLLTSAQIVPFQFVKQAQLKTKEEANNPAVDMSATGRFVSHPLAEIPIRGCSSAPFIISKRGMRRSHVFFGVIQDYFVRMLSVSCV